MKKPIDRFYTHIYFAPSVILIFGGIFLHRISRLLEPGERNQNQKKQVESQDRILKNDTPKTNPVTTAKFQSIEYATYSPQEWNHQDIFYFTLMGKQSNLITLQMPIYV